MTGKMKNKGAMDSTWLAPDVTIPADHLALFFTSCRRWTCLQAVCLANFCLLKLVLVYGELYIIVAMS